MRTYAPSPAVSADPIPLYLRGWKARGLGQTGPQAVASTAPIASAATTEAISSSAAAAGSGFWAAAAGPIGAGVAVVIGLIASFWAAHEARARGAKDENAAMNSAVRAFDQSIKAIFDAANSSDPAKNISATQAVQALEQIEQNYWAGMLPHMSGPGRADISNAGTNCPPTTTCNKSCTAGCCVGCYDIIPSVQNAITVFQNGGGTAQILTVYGSKYGGVERGGYTLTYTPPALPSAASSVASAIENIFSPSPSPGGSPGGAGLSSAFPWLLGAAIVAALVL